MRYLMWIFAGVSACCATSLQASALFPRLDPDDFPDRAEQARLARPQISPGVVGVESYYTVAPNVGFASRLQATLGINSLTRMRKLTVSRQDDACVRDARDARQDPTVICGQLRVFSLAPSVVQLLYRSPYHSYQVQFTMIETPARSGRWQLLRTGRRGEPDAIDFTMDSQGNLLQSHWRLTKTESAQRLEINTGVEITPSDYRGSGLTDTELGWLSGSDLFYQLAQRYAPTWVPYSEEGLIDSEPNDPGDHSSCTVQTSCGAEYQSCTPVPGGWLGCDYTGEHGPGLGGGGGGEGDLWGGAATQPPTTPPTNPPASLPDWVVGNRLSTPRKIPPYFNGMVIEQSGYTGELTRHLDYHISVVLAKADTVAKWSIPFGSYTSHEMYAILLRDSDLSLAVNHCGEGKSKNYPNAAAVPKGTAADFGFNQGGPPVDCSDALERGVYVLSYNLDPKNAWDEGAGESTNFGYFNGFYFVRLGYFP